MMFRILCQPNSVMQDETHSLFVMRDLLSGPFYEEFEKNFLNSDLIKKKEIWYEININYKRSGRHIYRYEFYNVYNNQNYEGVS